MLIKKLMLDGVGSFRNRTEIDMTKYTMCHIHGPNGSGKSSIHRAIGWILFGDTLIKDMDSIIHDFEDEAFGEMYFTQDGTDYWITRSKVRGGKNTVRMARLGEDGEWYHVQDHTNVSAKATSNISALAARDALPVITEVIKMTPQAWYALVTLPQSSLNRGGYTFTGSSPNDRRDFILSMVREVDEWAVYHSIAQNMLRQTKSDIADTSTRIDSIESGLDKLYDDIFDALQTAHRESGEDMGDIVGVAFRSSAKENIIGYKKAIRKIHELVEQTIERHEQAISENNDKIQSLNKSLNDIDSNRSTLQEELKKLASLREANNRELRLKIREATSNLRSIRSNTKRLTELLNQSNESSAKIESITLEIESLEKDIVDTASSLEELNERLESAEKNLSSAEKTLERRNVQHDEAVSRHQAHKLQADSDYAECIVCKTHLSDEKIDELMDEAKSDVESTQDKLDEAEANVESAERALNRVKSKVTRTKSSLSDMKRSLERKKQQVENLRDKIDEGKDEIASLRSTIKSMDDEDDIQADIDEWNEQIKDESDRELKLAEKIEDIDSDSEFGAKIRSLNTDNDKLNRTIRTLSRMDGKVDGYGEQARESEEQHKEQSQKLNELYDHRAALDYLNSALAPKGIPMKMVTSVLDSIEDKQNDMLFRIMGDKAFTVRFVQERYLKNGNTTETLDIIVHTKDGTTRPFELLSGGEATRVAMCNLFASIEVFNERHPGLIETVFLDEPFGAMDSDSMPAMIECITDAYNRGVVRQVFITDHHSEMRGILPQSIQVERVSDIDGSRIVSE